MGYLTQMLGLTVQNFLSAATGLVVVIALIRGALCIAFGRMVGDMRQGWTLFAAMTLLFVVFAVGAMSCEQQGNPLLAKVGADGTATTTLVDASMEGKETRFGIADSGLFATIATAASCGAVNAMHDSFTPLGGMDQRGAGQS